MTMKEKAIVSVVTLITSLVAYWYAKQASKDAVPYVMIGGFLGSIVGETIAEKTRTSNNDNKKIQ
jgi:hypothetical protein